MEKTTVAKKTGEQTTEEKKFQRIFKRGWLIKKERKLLPKMPVATLSFQTERPGARGQAAESVVSVANHRTPRQAGD